MQEYPELNNEGATLTDKQVFLMLFTHPKRAFAYIIQHRYEKYLGVIAVLIGIENAFSRAARQHMGNDYPLWGIVVFCVIIGCLFGYITLWFASYIIRITGRWLNGKAHTQGIFRVMTYSMVPSVFNLLVWALKIVLVGHVLFTSDFYLSDYTLVTQLIYYALSLLYFGITIWSIVLYVNGLAMVQQFSIGKALLNLLIPFVLLVVIGIVAFVVGDLLR